MKITEKLLVTKMRLNVETMPEIVSIFTQNVSYENGRSHFLLTKYKNKHNKDADTMNVDRIEESKEHRLNLITKISELESKIKKFDSRVEEAFENKEKLIKLYQLGAIDNDGENRR